MLQPHALAPRLDRALVVALAPAGEAGLEEVVAHQGPEAVGQLAVNAHPALHRGGEIVVDDPRRHAAEVGEGPHVAVEEGQLIAPVVDPHEVAARERQPHQELPCRAPEAALLDRDLEEVHLGLLARPVDERDVDLGALPAPLPQPAPDRRHADLEALLAQLPVESRAGDALLAGRPRQPLRHQLLEPRDHALEHRPRPRLALHPPRLRDLEVLAHRIPAHPQLPCHRAPRPALHQHLVSNNMHLIHPQHPSSSSSGRRQTEATGVGAGGGSVSKRWVGQFPSVASTSRA